MYRTYWKVNFVRLVAVILGSVGVVATSYAQQSSSAASGPLSKLTVHGFLTQAYATADYSEGGFVNPTQDEVAFGIPEDGTFDYRRLAIQFRYEISPKDIMIIQLSSRSLGTSPVQDVEDEVELDWAFYERRIGDSTGLKIGRVQVPLGIFNEIRDVGTILPFYRPSFVFYGEGTFTSETIDGVVLSHVFAPESSWSLEADFYVGEWDLIELSPFVPGGAALIARAQDAYGFQLWLNTPLQDLRLGLGLNSKKVSDGIPEFREPGTTDTADEIYFSFDYTGERLVLRGEFLEQTLSPNSRLFGGEFQRYYVQLGYNATQKIRVFLQQEWVDALSKKEDFALPFGIPATEDVDFKFKRDTGISLNYIFSPNLVLKLEHHFNVDFEQFIIVPVFTPGGPALQPLYDTAEDGEYSILSFSVSF